MASSPEYIDGEKGAHGRVSPTAYDQHNIPANETAAVGGRDGHELKRGLKGRHMQMIAIGGAIGAGLFVGAGQALSTGGPASLVGNLVVSPS
jgi:amino acid transporter